MPRKCATTLPCFSRAGGSSLGAWRHPMLMVDTDAVVVEARLLTGDLGCPSCGGVLRPWGHARWRFSRREEGTVRHRPRRASCTGCAKTHVLLSTAWLSRRGDAVSVIGSALLAKAAGLGHRRIAALLGRPACTVRGWLRRFGARAEDVRVFFTRLLHGLDPEAGPLLPRGSVFADALEALGRAGAAGVRRLGPRPPWEFASWATGGLLLTPPAKTGTVAGAVLGRVANTD
jgi:transposase-like protein